MTRCSYVWPEGHRWASRQCANPAMRGGGSYCWSHARERGDAIEGLGDRVGPETARLHALSAPRQKGEGMDYAVPIILRFEAADDDVARKIRDEIDNALESRSAEAYQTRDSLRLLPGNPEVQTLTFQDMGTDQTLWREDDEHGWTLLDEKGK